MVLRDGAGRGRDLAGSASNWPGTATEVDDAAWQEALTSACAERTQGPSNSLSTPGRRPGRRDRAALGPGRRSRRRRRRRPGPGYIAEVVEIIRQAAEAAHALHEAGVVHRDIKPGNIMITADGRQPC